MSLQTPISIEDQNKLLQQLYILRNTLMEFTSESHVSTKHIITKLNSILKEED